MYLLDVSIRFLKYFCVLFVLFVLFVYAVSFIAMLQSPSLMVLYILSEEDPEDNMSARADNIDISLLVD